MVASWDSDFPYPGNTTLFTYYLEDNWPQAYLNRTQVVSYFESKGWGHLLDFDLVLFGYE